MGFYLPRDASRRRVLEAQHARNNRAEIVRARSTKQVTRRELFKWGVFTSTGLIAAKSGLSPFVRSAYAQVPTGTPRSPLFGAQPFVQPLPRLQLQTPVAMGRQPNQGEIDAVFPAGLGERNAQRLSWHTDFSNFQGAVANNPFRNPVTNRGPFEGRPPGEFFSHQRWQEFFPQMGYLTSIGEIEPNTRFHPNFPAQNRDAVWAFGAGGLGTQGSLAPPLFKGRYGEPILTRIYNSLPVDELINGGFGLNEMSTHFHNAHNGAESDGASNAFHFPGTFYDYLWSTCLARHDTINQAATDRRASAPDGRGGLNLVPGDFREIQGTMWLHDHRFFFTAENVYKGVAAMINYYSGPDRGNESLDDGVNLRLPSGSVLDYGNLDFDVNLLIHDLATDPDGQLFFDIFDTDGFLGDLLMVNYAYKPFMEVLPRKYRFRLLNASMARIIQLAFAEPDGSPVPVQVVSNDGNLLPRPITKTVLIPQGTAERFDVVVDFSRFVVGSRINLVNVLVQTNGRRADGRLSTARAQQGVFYDPTVGNFMEFLVVSSVRSVDDPSVIHRASDPDPSRVPAILTEQIPIVAPVRERNVRWVRGGGDSKDTADGQCIPRCDTPEHIRENFPWAVRVNGQEAHSLNANRISMIIPRPGEVEHWTMENGGGGWDHPIHLHFEEGVTIDRQGDFVDPSERFARKDVWRLRPGGDVKFQVQFGEFGGAYVSHCHNTIHEDWAMLIRWDFISGTDEVHTAIIPTPIPTPDGVTYMTPEILPEGDPRFNNPDGTPLNPDNPANPIDPNNPVDPNDQDDAEDLDDANDQDDGAPAVDDRDDPVPPQKPAKPAKPVKPTQPTQPTRPDQPTKPQNPEADERKRRILKALERYPAWFVNRIKQLFPQLFQ